MQGVKVVCTCSVYSWLGAVVPVAFCSTLTADDTFKTCGRSRKLQSTSQLLRRSGIESLERLHPGTRCKSKQQRSEIWRYPAG